MPITTPFSDKCASQSGILFLWYRSHLREYLMLLFDTERGQHGQGNYGYLVEGKWARSFSKHGNKNTISVFKWKCATFLSHVIRATHLVIDVLLQLSTKCPCETKLHAVTIAHILCTTFVSYVIRATHLVIHVFLSFVHKMSNFHTYIIRLVSLAGRFTLLRILSISKSIFYFICQNLVPVTENKLLSHKNTPISLE